LLFCFMAVCTAAAGIAVTYHLPAVYKADALILVDPQKIPERFVATTVNLDAQDRLATISQEIQSSTRLEKLIDDFHLYGKERLTHSPEEIVQIMRKDIVIDLEKGVGGSRPGAFRVSFQGSDPVVVAQVVNRITDFYIEENARAREVRAEGTSDFIDKELGDAKRELERQEAALSRFKLEHNGELPEQENSLIAMTTQLQVALQGDQDSINRQEQEKIALEDALNASESLEARLTPRSATKSSKDEPEQDIAPPPQSKYRKEYEDLQAQLASLQPRYSDQHPDMIRLRSRIALVQNQLRQDEAKLQAAAERNANSPRPQAAPPIDPSTDPLALERVRAHERTTTLKSQVAAINRDLQIRRADREKILKSLDSYQRRIGQLPIREQEMASLTRDYEFSRNYYSSLFAKKADAEMASDLEKRQKAETFRILDAAKPPSKPFKPNRQLFGGMSMCIGLVLGLVTAVGRELKAGVLLGEWELPPGVVVLVRVPRIVPKLASIDESTGPKSGAKEQIGVKQPAALFSSAVFLLIGLVAVARDLWSVVHWV